MEFSFNPNECADVSLKVANGANGKVCVFFDKDVDAFCYKINFFRDEHGFKKGFLINDSEINQFLKYIKFITTIEINHNDLFLSVDFLSYGDYVLILEVENKEGMIIKKSFPLCFSISDPNQHVSRSTLLFWAIFIFMEKLLWQNYLRD